MRSTGLDKTTGAWDAGCYWVEDDGSVHRRPAGEFEDTSCYASVALLAYANILEAHHINLLAERDALREALQNVRVSLMHGPDDFYQKRTLIFVDSALALSEGR